MRATNMPIREMQRYAALRERGEASSLERRRILEEHRAVIVEQLGALEKAQTLLTHKIENYRAIEERIGIRKPAELSVERVAELVSAM
jgi:hypothetical protein